MEAETGIRERPAAGRTGHGRGSQSRNGTPDLPRFATQIGAMFYPRSCFAARWSIARQSEKTNDFQGL
jgi:hypothetical protein